MKGESMTDSTRTDLKTAEIEGRQMFCLDVLDAPVAVSGFPWLERERRFCRLPGDALPDMSDSVRRLAWCTSGGMARFRTDSDTIGIRVELAEVVDMPHMPRSGNSGFDIYVGSGAKKRFINAARPPMNERAYETLLVNGQNDAMREWTLNFPVYNGASRVVIGLDPGAKIEPPAPFAIEKPILFYGSSITHGGCASRPGNTYPNVLSRWLDANLVNFGFSGSARGEPEMARLIATVDMRVFVMDYDHNAPTADYLEQTHEAFFRIVRDARPELPVVIVSSPSINANPSRWTERREIIRRTYLNALERGDDRVWFVDGETLFGSTDQDACTVDGVHPNDLGFLRMAKAIRPSVEAACLA